MKVVRKGEAGLAACEEAFKRLIDRAPIVSGHVGLDTSKITAGVVSVEAGFDRGYLKKARKAHQPLLAKIEAYRIGKPSIVNSASDAKIVKRTQAKLNVMKAEVELACQQRDMVLTQNLQLCERIRELESELLAVETRLFTKSDRFFRLP